MVNHIWNSLLFRHFPPVFTINTKTLFLEAGLVSIHRKQLGKTDPVWAHTQASLSRWPINFEQFRLTAKLIGSLCFAHIQQLDLPPKHVCFISNTARSKVKY